MEKLTNNNKKKKYKKKNEKGILNTHKNSCVSH